MKKIIQFLGVFFFCMAFGQNKPISEKIQSAHIANQRFQDLEIFNLNIAATRLNTYSKAATDVSVLSLNNQALLKILKEKPHNIRIKIPYDKRLVEIELVRNNICTDDFTAKNEKGEIIDYRPGVYYQGIVKEDYSSIAAFSFFENDVIGIASSESLGNLTVGKAKNKQDFVAYSDKNLLGQNPFVCGVDELTENQNQNISFDNDMLSKVQMTENCVRIYYEITNAAYLINGSDETETLNWITAIHNNIHTLYENDDIRVALSEVMIWTTDDSYDGEYWQNLEKFRQIRTAFNGDIGHLVNYPSSTSIADVNSICTGSRYAYSGVNLFYEDVPVYSWTIEAMTHEMGHSMGSPHTHACAWNGNDTAIDGCGPWAGYSEGCDGELPDDGGTIMSYCHLAPVGINFAKGFGPQPATLIRNTVDSKLCLGTDCASSCMATVEGLEFQEISDSHYLLIINDVLSDEWIYRIYEYGDEPTEWQSSISSTIEITGLDMNKYYQVDVENVCENGEFEYSPRRYLILTGNWCGQNFTDTGGESGPYQTAQRLIKTFYPVNPGEKVKLTFSQFRLMSDWDFMYIYNGNSTEAPLFPNGDALTGNTIPGPFVSTAEDGSITVRFTSNDGNNNPGWVAEVECSVLSVEDQEGNTGINVYPNPANDMIRIEAPVKIEEIKLNDTSGKLLKMKKGRFSTEELDIGYLPKGAYLLIIKLKDKTITRKIIKN